MKKKSRLMLIFGLGIIAIVSAIIFFINIPRVNNVKYSEYTSINAALPENCRSCIVVSSDELQKWVAEDYNINLGQQDYSRHSLILTFNKKLKTFTEHIGSHPGYYKPAVRKEEELNFSTASYEEGDYDNTIFVYITDNTHIVCDDEYEYTCWD